MSRTAGSIRGLVSFISSKSLSPSVCTLCLYFAASPFLLFPSLCLWIWKLWVGCSMHSLAPVQFPLNSSDLVCCIVSFPTRTGTIAQLVPQNHINWTWQTCLLSGYLEGREALGFEVQDHPQLCIELKTRLGIYQTLSHQTKYQNCNKSHGRRGQQFVPVASPQARLKLLLVEAGTSFD